MNEADNCGYLLSAPGIRIPAQRKRQRRKSTRPVMPFHDVMVLASRDEMIRPPGPLGQLPQRNNASHHQSADVDN